VKIKETVTTEVFYSKFFAETLEKISLHTKKSVLKFLSILVNFITFQNELNERKVCAMKTINDLVWNAEENEPKEVDPRAVRMSCGGTMRLCSFCRHWVPSRHPICINCGHPF
jgi:hypothetical protein